MGGPTMDLQWFDRFQVVLPNGQALVDVNVRRHGAPANRTLFRRGMFNQLDVRLFGQGQPMKRLKRVMFATHGVKVNIGSDFWGRPRTHSGEIAEHITIETNSIHFIMFASHAGTEFPHDIDMQSRYTHMDLVCMEMDEFLKPSFTGILPEIWGWSPMSDQVAAMLVAPSEANQSTPHVPQNACGNSASQQVHNCAAN